MPIQVSCENCQKTLKVRDELAGKRIKCTQCQSVITIPAPAAQPDAWYLQTEDGETYGPVPRSELDEWAKEGRVTAACQVLREGDEQWQWATDVYPYLASEAGTVDAAPTPSAPASTQAPTPQVSAAPQTAPSAGGSGPFDFSSLGSAPAEAPSSGPFDFAPSETSGASSAPAAPAFDFGADPGRGGRSRSRGGKSAKGQGGAAAATAPPSGSGSSIKLTEPAASSVAPASASAKRTGTAGMQRLTKVGVLSFAKVMGASSALMGLVIGVLQGTLTIVLGLIGASSELGGGFGAMGIVGGLVIMVMTPIVSGVFGFLFGLLYALIINLVLGFAGGLEIELQ